MSDPMFQPPNPADLRRQPPATPECARVRGMLRDYVDGDLGVGHAGLVDEHVASCRVCSVELARTEHETLRLRRAFEQLAASERMLRPDFASRVVEQLVLTEGFRRDADEDGDDDGPVTGGPHAGERDFLRFGPIATLLTGVAVLVLLVVGVRLFDAREAAPGHVARLVVLSAADTYDGQRRLLAAGDSLGEQQSLWVRRGGAVRIDWHDTSERAQPAATMEVTGGELKLEDGSPLLVDGKILIETNRGVAIPMADGSRIELHVGEYVIAAEIPSDMLDDEAHEPDGGGSALPGELRIEVEVRSGEPAQVVRSNAPVAVVSIGRSGVYSGSGAIELSPGPLADLGGRTGRTPVTPEIIEPSNALSGYVVGPGGVPSRDTEVLLAYASQSQVVQAWQLSRENGNFLVEGEAPCESDFAVVMAVPAPNLGQAFVAPHPVALLRQNGFAHLNKPVQVHGSIALRGLVRDNAGQVRVHARIKPCIVDELFGTVMMLVGHFTTTDANGVFRVDGLPATLPKHQHLAVLVWQDGVEPTIVPVPVRGDVLAVPDVLPITVQKDRSIQLHQLPVNTPLTIFEEVPGLPLGTAVVVHQVTSDAQGRVLAAMVGRGRLWLLTGTPLFQMVQPLVLDQIAGLPRYRPDGPPVDLRRRFRQLQNVIGTNMRLAHHYRYENIEVQPIENVVSSQALRVVDEFGRTVEGCEVFAVAQSITRLLPDARFLGMTNAAGVLSLGNVKTHEDVFVIGPAGGVAWVSRPGSLGLAVSVTLQASGRVLLDESLRPDPANPVQQRALIFRRDGAEVLNGMRPVAVRFAGVANSWEVSGLPPGHYWVELDQQVYEINVPSQGFVRLEPQ
ncbi:MAG: zf-HC2 domain-containing protein [Planctomycetes bacterium]|nr:zf-HC2 domain-containing protein [Planctomycetota bacterium]